MQAGGRPALMLAGMGADGFAERAARELRATGERVRKRVSDVPTKFTERETPIALHKVFGMPLVSAGRCLFGEEVEEGGVDDVGVGPGDVVRAALDGDECQVLDKRG